MASSSAVCQSAPAPTFQRLRQRQVHCFGLGVTYAALGLSLASVVPRGKVSRASSGPTSCGTIGLRKRSSGGWHWSAAWHLGQSHLTNHSSRSCFATRLNSGVGLQFGLEVFSRVALPYRVLQWSAPEKPLRQGCAARTGVACGGFGFGAAHRSGCRGVSSSVSFGRPHRGCLWQAFVMRSRCGGLRLQALRVSVAAI